MVRSNPEENSFFPLEVGNSWNYVTMFSMYPAPVYSRRDFKVTDEMMFNGNRIFKLEKGWISIENEHDHTTPHNYREVGWFTEIDSILYYCDVDSIFSNIMESGFIINQDFTIDVEDGECVLPGTQLHIIPTDHYGILSITEYWPEITSEELASYMWASEVLGCGFLNYHGLVTEYKQIFYTSQAAEDINHVITWARGVGIIEHYNYEGGWGWIEGCRINGISYGIVSNENAEVTVPEITANNYPNPFNPETTIEFYNPRAGKVAINIYNIKGQLVKSLLNQNMAQGTNSVVWDGRDANNNQIASGIYFYKLETDSKTITKKMILMK